MSRFEVNVDQLRELSAPKRKALLERLRAFRELVKLNPLFDYDPMPPQIDYHTARQRVIAYTGGNRAGKTTAGVVQDLLDCLSVKDIPEHLRAYKMFDPPTFGRIVTPALTQNAEGVILDKFRKLSPGYAMVGGSLDKAYDKKRRRIRFTNGSYVDFLSAEQDLAQHGGDDLHFVHFDEEPTGLRGYRVFEESLWRIIDHDGQIRLTLTPLDGLSWSYDELTDDGVPRRDDEVHVVTASVRDNVHMDPKALEDIIARTPKHMRDARIEGRYTHFGGLIFKPFDEQYHVIPAHPPPPGTTVVVGVDPGVRHMAALVWLYLDEDDNMVAFHEAALEPQEEEGVTVRRVVEAWREVNTHYDIKPLWNIIDPAARDRGHQTGRSDQSLYIQLGMNVLAGQNARRASYDAINMRLDAVTEERLEGKPSAFPKLYVTDNCPTLIHQIKRYRWKPATPGSPVGREEPLKVDDHLVDALRYAVMSRPALPDPYAKDPLEGRSPAEVALYHHVNRNRERPRFEAYSAGRVLS